MPTNINQRNEFRDFLSQPLGALKDWQTFVTFIDSELTAAINDDHTLTFTAAPGESLSVETFVRQLYLFIVDPDFQLERYIPGILPQQLAAIRTAAQTVAESRSAVFLGNSEVGSLGAVKEALNELARKLSEAHDNSAGQEQPVQPEWQEELESVYRQNNGLIKRITDKVTQLKTLAYAEGDDADSLTNPQAIEPNEKAREYEVTLKQKAEAGETLVEQEEAAELLTKIEQIKSNFEGLSVLKKEAKELLETKLRPQSSISEPIHFIQQAIITSKNADEFQEENLIETLEPYWSLRFSIDASVGFDSILITLQQLDADISSLLEEISEPFAAARKQQVEALSQSILQASAAAAPADAGGGSDDDEEEDEKQEQRQAQAVDRFQRLTEQLTALSTVTGSILQTNSLPGTSDRILDAFQSTARDHLGGKELPVDNPIDFLLAVEDQINAQTSLSEDFFATYENFLEALEKSLNRFSPTAPEVERPESELPTATVPTPFIVPGVGEIDPEEVKKARQNLGEITRIQALLVTEAETYIRQNLEAAGIDGPNIERILDDHHDDLSQLLWTEFLQKGGLSGELTSFRSVATIWIDVSDVMLSHIETQLGSGTLIGQSSQDGESTDASGQTYEQRLEQALANAGFSNSDHVFQLVQQYSTPQGFGHLEEAAKLITHFESINQDIKVIQQQLAAAFEKHPELRSLFANQESTEENVASLLKVLIELGNTSDKFFEAQFFEHPLESFEPLSGFQNISRNSALADTLKAFQTFFQQNQELIGNAYEYQKITRRYQDLARKYQADPRSLSQEELDEFFKLFATFYPFLMAIHQAGLADQIYALTQGKEEILRVATEMRRTATQQAAAYRQISRAAAQSQPGTSVRTMAVMVPTGLSSPESLSAEEASAATNGRGNITLKKMLYQQYYQTDELQIITFEEFNVTLTLLLREDNVTAQQINAALLRQQMLIEASRQGLPLDATGEIPYGPLGAAMNGEAMQARHRGMSGVRGGTRRPSSVRQNIRKIRMAQKLLATGGNPAALAAMALADPEMRKKLFKNLIPLAILSFLFFILTVLLPLLLMLMALAALVYLAIQIGKAIIDFFSGIANSIGSFLSGGGGAEIASSAIPASQSALSATAVGTKAALTEAQAAAAKTGSSVITTSNAVITGVSTASTSAALIAVAILGPFMMLTLLTVIVMTVIGGSMNDLPFEGIGSGSEWLLTEDTACLNIDVTSFERASLEEDLPRFEAAAVRAMQNSDARKVCDLLTNNNHRIVIAVNERWILAGRSRSGSTSELGFSSDFIIDSREWNPDNLVFTIFHELAHVLQDFSDLTGVYTQAANGQLIRSYPLDNSNSESSAEAMAWYLMGEPAPRIYKERNGVDVNVTLSSEYPNIYRAYQNFFANLN